MKKLLALILCVMMFVAVIPTSAFATTGVNYTAPLEGKAKPTWAAKSAATKAVEDLGDAIKAMYTGVAADQGVFNTVVAIDDTIKSLSDKMFEGVDKATFVVNGKTRNYTTNKQLTDASKAYLREHVGAEITKYMKDHESSFTSTKTLAGGGTRTIIDPVKYMNAFATAASKAMSSEKAAKNIEAIVYAAAMAKVQKDTKDAMDDLYADMVAWGGLDDLKAYGWTNVVGDPASSDWEPYVFLDADNPYYDGSKTSNISEVLAEFVK
jgi:hypothetical protein